MFGGYRGDLTLERSTTAKSLLKISADLALSWFPAHATIAWSETQANYCPVATRNPTYTGTLAEVPFEPEL